MKTLTSILALFAISTLSYGSNTLESDMALVVVDMQSGFEHRDQVVDRVLEKISTCIQKNGHLIIVETECWGHSFGKTHPTITTTYTNYPHITTVVKQDGNGAREIFRAMYQKRERVLPHTIYVVGGPNEDSFNQTIASMSKIIDTNHYNIRIVVPTHAVYGRYPSLWSWSGLFKESKVLSHVCFVGEKQYPGDDFLYLNRKKTLIYLSSLCSFFVLSHFFYT